MEPVVAGDFRVKMLLVICGFVIGDNEDGRKGLCGKMKICLFFFLENCSLLFYFLFFWRERVFD